VKRRIVLAVIVSLAVLVPVGCGQEQAPVGEPAAPSAPPANLDQTTEAAKAASDQVGEMADTAVGQVGEMIRQVKGSLAEDKVDAARELMDRLVALKDSLPDSLRAEIDRLEAMFPAE
jgi:hypothetical protein